MRYRRARGSGNAKLQKQNLYAYAQEALVPASAWLTPKKPANPLISAPFHERSSRSRNWVKSIGWP